MTKLLPLFFKLKNLSDFGLFTNINEIRKFYPEPIYILSKYFSISRHRATHPRPGTYRSGAVTAPGARCGSGQSGSACASSPRADTHTPCGLAHSTGCAASLNRCRYRLQSWTTTHPYVLCDASLCSHNVLARRPQHSIPAHGIRRIGATATTPAKGCCVRICIGL